MRTDQQRLTPQLLAIMAVACAMGLANNYYCQPLLVEIGRDLHTTDHLVGAIPTLTQFGMALGILLLAPLGDKSERRSLVVATTLACAVSLFVFASARNIAVLQVASFAVGLTSVVSTLVLPFAVSLGQPSQRGQIVGVISSAMLLGILLSRTLSGVVGEAFGWRTMFTFAGLLMLALAGGLRLLLPRSTPSVSLPYGRLLTSMGDLVKEHRILREATINGILLYAALSAFWASLVFFAESPVYHYGPSVIGMFGFVGAVSALGAPIVGRLADRTNPRRIVGFAALLMLGSYFLLGLFGAHLWGLILGIVVLDLASQAATVSNQATVYSLQPHIHSRAYTVYRACYSLGGAMGAFLGIWGWTVARWNGVCLVGIALTTTALAFHWAAKRQTTLQTQKMELEAA